MLADQLLGMPELQRELVITELINDPRANGGSLSGGKLLEQVQCPPPRTNQLLHTQEVLIVKRERRHSQALSCFDLDSSASCALTQLVARYPKQPRQRRRLARLVAPASKQRRRERLAGEVSRDLLRAHSAGKKRKNLGDVPTIERCESRAITRRCRQQQLVIAPRIIVRDHYE